MLTGVVLQIVPASSNGVDAVNFRPLKESSSLHLDRHTAKKQGGQDTLKAVAGKPSSRLKTSPGSVGGDDGIDTPPTTPGTPASEKDLFGAFANVTLHYDGET
jgi:protein-serine/threonine kinase